MNKKPVEKRIESVTKQPLLTDFPSTIFRNKLLGEENGESVR